MHNQCTTSAQPVHNARRTTIRGERGETVMPRGGLAGAERALISFAPAGHEIGGREVLPHLAVLQS